MSKSDNEVPAPISPDDGEAQGAEVDWTNISIAVPRDIKERFEALAARKHLRPSPFGRLVIVEAVERGERELVAS